MMEHGFLMRGCRLCKMEGEMGIRNVFEIGVVENKEEHARLLTCSEQMRRRGRYLCLTKDMCNKH